MVPILIDMMTQCIRCPDITGGTILTFRCSISELLKASVGELVNGIPPHLMNRSTHIENHYLLGPAFLGTYKAYIQSCVVNKHFSLLLMLCRPIVKLFLYFSVHWNIYNKSCGVRFTNIQFLTLTINHTHTLLLTIHKWACEHFRDLIMFHWVPPRRDNMFVFRGISASKNIFQV